MASHISAAAWAWTSVLPSEQYDRWTPNENRKHLLTKLPPRASKSKCQIWRRPGHATSAPGCQYPMHERQAAGSSETDPHSLLQLLTNTIPAPVTSLSIRVLHPSPWPHRSASAPHASICPNAKRPQPPAASLSIPFLYPGSNAQASICSSMYSSNSGTVTRRCSVLSRSRMVTVSSSRVSKSTVMQKGVPTSSIRR